jgi:Tfp pilus assembly protein PilF
MVEEKYAMQTCRKLTNRKLGNLGCWGLGCVLVALVGAAPQADAQFGMNGGGRSTIEGSVLIDGMTQPAARIRVDVKAVSGGGAVTTFTDSSGRFQAPAQGTGSVIVAVQEDGYEPVEQRVEVGFQGSTSGVLITLRKLKASLVDRGGYTVSIHDLKVPGKARREFEKGIARLQKNDIEGSLSHFKEATNAFPNYYEAYYQIGLADLELRRGNDAEQALQRSIDLSGGGYAEPQFALGALLCERQSYQEAERVLRRAIEVDGNSWRGHFFLGQALFGQNRLAEAEKSAQEVLLRRSDAASAYILLANIHIRRQEYILGIKDLDTYLSLRPEGASSERAREVRAAALRVVSRGEQMVTAPRSVY